MKKTISKFKEAAFCGSFRDDGQLMVVGDGNGSVKVESCCDVVFFVSVE